MSNRLVANDDIQHHRKNHKFNCRQRSSEPVYSVGAVRCIHSKPENKCGYWHVYPHRHDPHALPKRQPYECRMSLRDEVGDRHGADRIQQALLQFTPRHLGSVVKIAEKHGCVYRYNRKKVPYRKRNENQYDWQDYRRDKETGAGRLAGGRHAAKILAQHLAAVSRQTVPKLGQKHPCENRSGERAPRQKQGVGLQQTKRTPKRRQILRDVV